MENEDRKLSKFRPLINTIITILAVDAVLVVISVGSRATLFFLGLIVMIIGYSLNSLFFGRYVMRGASLDSSGRKRAGQGYVYPSSSKETTEFDQYKTEEGSINESDLDQVRKPPSLLLNISFAGIIALILSFILPWLS